MSKTDYPYDIYREYVMAALTADFNANGYSVTLVPGETDWLVSKKEEATFAVQCCTYENLDQFFQSNRSQKSHTVDLFGHSFPLFYVALDSKQEKMAMEDTLLQRLGHHTSNMNITFYSIPKPPTSSTFLINSKT